MRFSFLRREIHSDLASASIGVLERPALPFEIKRVYWITNFAAGASRGNHAHKTLNQVLIMIFGQLELQLFYGLEKTSIRLTPESHYVFVPAGYWRVMKNASADAVLLVVADSEYSEQDYIRNWSEYQEWFLGHKNGS